jgi:hypothetical protein
MRVTEKLAGKASRMVDAIKLLYPALLRAVAKWDTVQTDAELSGHHVRRPHQRGRRAEVNRKPLSAHRGDELRSFSLRPNTQSKITPRTVYTDSLTPPRSAHPSFSAFTAISFRRASRYD